MDKFLEMADTMVIYHLRKSWLMISKLYNEMAQEHDGTLAMAFVLLAINEHSGTPVTKIAPRIGMEPNSLSRLLKSMEQKALLSRRKDEVDKRQVIVMLTDAGKAKRKLALKAVFQLETAITDTLAQEKIDAFFEVTRMIPKAVAFFGKELNTEIIENGQKD